MLVAEHAPIGLGRERENRMLHRGHVILGDGVENIANEQIGIGIANWQQGRATLRAVRGFVDGKRKFGVSLTVRLDWGFHCRPLSVWGLIYAPKKVEVSFTGGETSRLRKR